tara:strand:+ start:285 stop:872 length:588 start_codon:yes stop_codon:yes gene_type:complete
VHHQSWGNERFSKGAYIQFALGQVQTLVPHMANTDGKLHFAGEHTEFMYSGMESAIVSGLRATQEVFERLNIPCVAIFIRSTKMKFILVISFIAGGLMACSPQDQQDTKQQKSAEEAGKSSQIIFECERNEAITVRFFTDSDRAVMTRNNEDIELKQARTASGFLYSNGLNSIRGKGDDLSVQIGRMSPINCRAM